ncbi:MAG: ribosome maturation factor RimP [Amphibacillus sp.]|uniref:Ribosome maturation factor RimP n=1 Tax=Amphibacillus xylanus (strain ATCC 51415 / DSM 6626 / JCM 7361 / LMG 17667 / NBRC 15112 / Ep01) TaxID=698758 RepID=K0IYQ3_AMPXN|nr:ribosome maturation factor RimP [Amphibacillus xylanus]NMA91243.1 ribosome maturation factor RimP [Amphibacillus sp.]BAM47594.1 ribosome maturation factor RimP [Amphibacillus xylanus NBRC 15112]
MSKSVKEQTKEIVMPLLTEMNLELVDIEYVKEGKDWFLRVFIDKPGGVDIEECGQLSERLSEKLDEHDPIKAAYYLEVSSPGAERPLKTREDLQNQIGRHVHVSLYQHINNEKSYEGKLIAFDESDIVVIEFNDKGRMRQVEIPYDKIAKARLAVSFN